MKGASLWIVGDFRPDEFVSTPESADHCRGLIFSDVFRFELKNVHFR
jgi:hypothetical protein